MARTTFTKSITSFNQRVLSLGDLENKTWSLTEVKEKFSFNKIFMSNMEEVFYKLKWREIQESYISSLQIFLRNITNILLNLEDLKFLKTTRDPIQNLPKINGINSIFCASNDLKKYSFANGELYYLTKQPGGVIITALDSKHALYNNPIKRNGYAIKADDYIRWTLSSLYSEDTLVIKVTTSENGKMNKVEYYCDNVESAKILSYFSKSSLILKNPFLYIKDIEMWLDEIELYPVKLIQDLTPLDPITLGYRDHLIEYPTDDFDVYLGFLVNMSKCSDVDSIQLSLYRIGKDPTIFHILKEAVENGIKVHVNIELCASGEDINKVWMSEMIKAGIDVTTYASGIIKVHSKLTLIKFINGNMISQIGTGNYHTQTTTQYTDFSLLTSDPNICRQVEAIFNIFKGFPLLTEFDSDFLVSRYNLRESLDYLIRREAHPGGYIVIKCNSLDDDRIIESLDYASSKGCQLDLIVRGACTWIPERINQNVRIKSVVWDKLEHSRVYSFGKLNPIVYIGSLDPTTTKLDNRIETLVRIKDPKILEYLCKYLNRYIINTKNSWSLTRSGFYRKYS